MGGGIAMAALVGSLAIGILAGLGVQSLGGSNGASAGVALLVTCAIIGLIFWAGERRG
jgi:Ca2+/Na+ antiporter